MSFQDDAREKEMCERFNLMRLEGRSGTDAVLVLDSNHVSFELKSTSNNAVTTTRDLGHDYLNKMSDRHFLVAFYKGSEVKYKYASPDVMKKWIEEKRMYIGSYLKLASHIAASVDYDCLYEFVGNKDMYTVEEAKSLYLNFFSKTQYQQKRDVPGGYSKEAMRSMLAEVVEHKFKRGCTLNNPKIPASYFKNCPDISVDHPSNIRRLVNEYNANSYENKNQ